MYKSLLYFALIVDEFTNEKAEHENVRFGLEVTNAGGSPAPLNLLADSVEIDGKSGEIKMINYQADRRNSKAKDIRLRVVAERMGPGKLERIASPYFYPVLTEEGGEPVEGLKFYLRMPFKFI